MIRRSSCCRAAQRRRLVFPMSCSQVKYFKETSHKENLEKRRHISLPRERPMARDDSMGKGNGGGNNQFCLAKGKVVALGRAGTAHLPVTHPC